MLTVENHTTNWAYADTWKLLQACWRWLQNHGYAVSSPERTDNGTDILR